MYEEIYKFIRHAAELVFGSLGPKSHIYKMCFSWIIN